MKNLSLIASALAMLGLTACEKGLVDGVAVVVVALSPLGLVDEFSLRRGGVGSVGYVEVAGHE